MGVCAKQAFTDITLQRFHCIQARASASYGISISGNQGSASKNGITIEWCYDPTTLILELQCIESPFFVSCPKINGSILSLADSC